MHKGSFVAFRRHGTLPPLQFARIYRALFITALPNNESRLFVVQANNESRAARPRLSILVADDDVDTVLTLAEMLRDEGHIVHTCASAMVVVEAIQRYQPDICLLDIVMPSKTGFTIAREV